MNLQQKIMRKDLWEIDETADGVSDQDEEKKEPEDDDYEDRKPYKISDREENRRHSGRKIRQLMFQKGLWLNRLWQPV